MSKNTDYFSRHGAGVLAKIIEKVWHDRGHRQVRAEWFELEGMPGIWGVRSNLVNGKPPGK